ncbi:unnamed protein product [Vicia faba]|uniref:X8 domain-containing protein n=1 Tax=Vicia faba TaxID=3906 RepID=A0AAV1AY42_VICFA|nr:unnamed protein product [Vicia faba]
MPRFKTTLSDVLHYCVKSPAPTSCDFGGIATIVTTNPSYGTCIFSSSSGGGAGSSGSGSNSSSIGFGGPSTSQDSSHSTGLRPLQSFMILYNSSILVSIQKITISVISIQGKKNFIFKILIL